MIPLREIVGLVVLIVVVCYSVAAAEVVFDYVGLRLNPKYRDLDHDTIVKIIQRPAPASRPARWRPPVQETFETSEGE